MGRHIAFVYAHDIPKADVCLLNLGRGSDCKCQPFPVASMLLLCSILVVSNFPSFIWGSLAKDTGVVYHFLLQFILKMRKLRQTGLSDLPRITQLVSA